jgi:hypothetical protein
MVIKIFFAYNNHQENKEIDSLILFFNLFVTKFKKTKIKFIYYQFCQLFNTLGDFWQVLGLSQVLWFEGAFHAISENSLPNLTRFYLVLPGLTRFCQALQGFARSCKRF